MEKVLEDFRGVYDSVLTFDDGKELISRTIVDGMSHAWMFVVKSADREVGHYHEIGLALKAYNEL